MENKFNIGDVVQLKSGGPKMTVHNLVQQANNFTKEPMLYCIWFNDCKLESGYFQQNGVTNPRFM